MARQAAGQLYINRSKETGKITSTGVRFRYAGKRRYVRLDAMTERDARAEMGYFMADVARGLWTPPEDRAPEPEVREVPTFAEFASDWYRGLCEEGGRDGKGIGKKSRENLMWRLGHLRTFGPMRLDEITVEAVDKYRQRKVREGKLGASSINRMLETLAAVLDLGVEYGHIDRNPAKGKRRRLRTARPRRPYLASAEHISALLDAARTLDSGELRRTLPWRRALVAVLTFAGLRISEALALRWRDVNLAGGTIHVAGTKTDAADRIVRMLPLLRDELLAYAAARPDRDPNALVFATAATGRYAGGKAHSPSNIRNRTLAPAVEYANEVLRKRKHPEMPSLTPHALRRTFASLLVAMGRDIAVTMSQLGHTSPQMTLGVYAAAMDWADGEREALRALIEGSNGQRSGQTEGERVELDAVEAAA